MEDSLPAKLRVCFFGTYPRKYTVSRILRLSAEAAGFDLSECHVPLWERDVVKPAAYFRFPVLATRALNYLAAAARLSWCRYRRQTDVDVFLVGFQGQLDVLLLRALRVRRPVLFAPLVSMTETLVEDRGVLHQGSLAARVLGSLDRKSLLAADAVVVDTQEHAAYLRRTFGIPSERCAVFYLGADWSVFRPAALPPDASQLRVLFYGSFLPLHGVGTILAAAERLRDRANVLFTLCGDGWEYALWKQTASEKRLENVRYLPWVEYESLQDLIAGHHVCLGSFGDGQKARMVIPNKVYQCAFVGRPVITADTPAVREVFVDRDTIWLVPPANPAALAEAILGFARDLSLRERLAARAREFMTAHFSAERQGERLRRLIEERVVR